MHPGQHHWLVEETGFLTADFASTGSLAHAMAAFNDVTRAVAETQGVIFVDAAARIPKDLRHHTDEVHYTALGARVLAETVAQAIIDNRLIEARSGR